MSASDDIWIRVKPALDHAFELDDAAREVYLQSLAETDRDVANEVKRYLDRDAQSDDFLEDRPDILPDLAEFVEDDDGRFGPGDKIGPYEVTRLIGRGGMGNVYLAERSTSDFRQKVALKIIRRGLDTDDILRRFRNERQILANLAHPNIAGLIGGGATDDGRPFFAMEFVQGATITEYCERENLGVRARIQLFREVCSAVQHAHKNLIVHRDIKPSNIIVNDDGVVKLLDFGIAKVISSDMPDYSVPMTRTEVRILTVAYASPEQVRGDQITTASDVYSLGVLLCELLSGQRPLETETENRTEAAKIVLEQPPTRPSALCPQDLRRELVGDIDNIVLTTLRKEPDRRYGSVEAFDADLERFLEGMPVQARGSSTAYRISKFAKRHKVGVASAAVLSLMIVGFGVISAIQAARIARERDAANAERAKAEQVSTFMADLFSLADPARSSGQVITARELLDRGAQRVTDELSDQPDIQAHMMRTIGEAYAGLALYGQADTLLQSAIRIEGESRLDGTQGLVSLARLRYQQARYREADSVAAIALGQIESDVGSAPGEVGRAHALVGRIQFAMGRMDDAEQAQLAALDLLAEADTTSADISLVKIDLAKTLAAADRFAEADSIVTATLIEVRAVHGDTSSQVAAGLRELADIQRDSGDLAVAESNYSEAARLNQLVFGAAHPEIARDLDRLAMVASDGGNYDGAERLSLQAIQLTTSILGEGNPLTLRFKHNLASIYLNAERNSEARAIYEEIIPKAEAEIGERHPLTALMRHDYSHTLEELGLIEESRAEMYRVLDIYEELYGPSHSEVAMMSSSMAVFLAMNTDRSAEAESLAVRALDIRRELLPENHPDLANSLITTGAIIQLRSPEEGEPYLREAVEVRTVALEPGHWKIAEAHRMHAKCLLDMKRYDEAEAKLVQAHADLLESRGPDSYYTQAAEQLLDRLYAERDG